MKAPEHNAESHVNQVHPSFVMREEREEFMRKGAFIHASGVLDFLLDRTALWVGGLRKVGIDLKLRHIGLHRVAWLQ